MALLDYDISCAITFKGAQFAWAIIKGYKKIENRSYRLPTNKWIAIHIGQGVLKEDYRRLVPNDDMPSEKELMKSWRSSIIGCLMIKEHRHLDNCCGDCWATGPICNVIDKVLVFSNTIVGIKGKLSTWRLSPTIQAKIQSEIQLNSIIINDLSSLPPLLPITTMTRKLTLAPSCSAQSPSIYSLINITKIFDDTEADDIFKYLSQLPYQYHKKYMRFNKLAKVPRGQASFTLSSNIHYNYKVAGGSPPNIVADCRMKDIIIKVNERLGTNFNTCLMNVYKDGDDCIGFHQDNEDGWAKHSGFATVAFGVTRDIQIKSSQIKTVNIPHIRGHCIYFRYPANRIYQHSVPKRRKVISTRISLTLREIAPW